MYKPSSRSSSEPASTADLLLGSLLGRRQSGSANLIIIIVLVVLVIVGAGLFVWSRQGDKTSNADTSTDSTTITVPKIAEKEDTAEMILEVELLLQRSGDEDMLPTETPETFVEYMTVKLNDFDCDFEEFPEGGYSVSKISPRFIAGGLGCGGGAGIVWYLTTAGWEELGFQSYVPCSTLVEFAIPSEFLADCYDDASPGQETIPNPNGSLN